MFCQKNPDNMYVMEKILDKNVKMGLDDSIPHFLFSSRFAMAVLAFFGFLAMNSQKVAIDLALPCMLNHTAIEVNTVNQEINETPKQLRLVNETDENIVNMAQTSDCGGASIELDILKLKLNFTYSTKTGELVWPVTRQNVLARTFYWGFVVGFLPCGWLSERIGGKYVFGVAMMSMSATTSLIALSTRTHYFVLILLRFIAGIAAGACFPAMHSIWGKWAPPLERSNLAAISYSGFMVGRSLTFPLVGALCQYGFLGGWPSVFYVLGAYGFLWSILWLIFTKNFPSQHGRLSADEKRYLQSTLVKETITEPRTDISVPCFSIITSLPFISVIISHFTFVWILQTYEYYIPIYFSEILSYEYRENGFFNMIPYMGISFFMVISSLWADQLRSRGVMGTAAARKIMNTVGSAIPAGMLIGLGFINCSQWIGAVCMLTIGMCCVGFQGAGFFISHLDLAPQYSGFLMGVSGCLGTLAEFAEPYLVKTLTPENTHEQWQTVFFISGCLGLFGGLCFLLCGSGEVQSWARVEGYASTTVSPAFSLGSSVQSLESITKSKGKLNSIGLQPDVYATLDSATVKKKNLNRSLSENTYNYSVPVNLISYGDPIIYRSLTGKKDSQKKLLGQIEPASFHTLEYPSRRITKSFEVDQKRPVVKKIADSDPSVAVGSLERSKKSTGEGKRKKELSNKAFEISSDIPHALIVSENSLKRNVNKTSSLKSNIMDDPPSADKPSSSSAGSSKKSKNSKQGSKRSTNSTHSKDTFEHLSESKV